MQGMASWVKRMESKTLSDDVWRMIRRQEKAVEDMENIIRIPGHDSPSLREQLRQANDRLSHLYDTADEVRQGVN